MASLAEREDWLDEASPSPHASRVAADLRDIGSISVHSGSIWAAVPLLLTSAAAGGAFGALLVSGALWSSFLYPPGYVLLLVLVWKGLRALTHRLFGAAMRWAGLINFFFAFLLGLFALIGAQIESSGWAHGIAIGFGLVVGLVGGCLDGQPIKGGENWVLVGFPLGPVATYAAFWLFRGPLAGFDPLAAAALAGAAAGLVYYLPMMPFLARNWDNSIGLRRVALLCLKHEDHYPDAIRNLDRGLELSPDDPELLTVRGLVWSRSGDDSRAEADWQRAIERDANAADPWLCRGLHRLERDRPAEAAEDFEAALKRNRRSDRALAGLADALDRLGRRGEALDHLDQAAKIAPFRTSHRVARTRMLIEAGREEEALADLDVLISRPAGCGAARLMRARIRAARGDLDGAAEDYQAMIDGDCDTEEEFQAAWSGMEEMGLIPET